MFPQNPLNQMTGYNIVRAGANAIDRAFGDIPFFSNPFAPKPPAPAPKPQPPKGPTQAPKTVPPDNGYSEYAASIRAQTQALLRQIDAMPRLPTFDIMGNYNRAKTQAAQNQRPLYDKMLNTFLEQQSIKKVNKQKEISLGKEGVEVSRVNTRADNDLTRTRTAEDVAAAIAKIGETETNFQTDEGKQFDAERRALQEGVAAAGLTTSGLGQQAVGEAEANRNVASERQVQEFDTQRQAKQLFQERTFEDLARGNLRADEKAVLDNKQLDLDFENYLSELAMAETNYRQDWEIDLAGAIAEETSRLDREGRMQFINSLAGSGARAQDIALAQQVYGR